MSAQEVQVEESQGRSGLKRKLTGPPRLLLGKFRAKAPCDALTDFCPEEPNSPSDSKETRVGSPKDQHGHSKEDGSSGPNISEESLQDQTGVRPELESEQPPIVGSVGDEKVPVVGASVDDHAPLEACPTAMENGEERDGRDAGGNMAKGQARKSSRRWLWASTLAWIRRPGRRSCRDRGEGGPVHDTKTSLAAENLVGDHSGPSRESKAAVSHYQGDAARDGKHGISNRTRSTLKRLITPNRSKKSKRAQLEPAAQSESTGPISQKASFRKKLGLFFKRGSKSSSATFDQGETRTSLDKEDAGQPVAGEEKAAVREGVCSEAAMKSGGHVTVNVEVSSLDRGAPGERSSLRGGGPADDRESLAGLRTATEEYKPQRSCKEEPDRPERRLKSDLPSKTAGVLPPVMEESTTAESDWSPCVGSDSRRDRLEESNGRSLLDVTHAGKDRIQENIPSPLAEITGVRNSSSGAALGSSLRDQVTLNGIDCVGYLTKSPVSTGTEIVASNGLMGSPSEDLQPAVRCLLNDLPLGESGPHSCETLLAQTASTLVQAAVKAALEQLTAEQEAQACRCEL